MTERVIVERDRVRVVSAAHSIIRVEGSSTGTPLPANTDAGRNVISGLNGALDTEAAAADTPPLPTDTAAGRNVITGAGGELATEEVLPDAPPLPADTVTGRNVVSGVAGELATEEPMPAGTPLPSDTAAGRNVVSGEGGVLATEDPVPEAPPLPADTVTGRNVVSGPAGSLTTADPVPETPPLPANTVAGRNVVSGEGGALTTADPAPDTPPLPANTVAGRNVISGAGGELTTGPLPADGEDGEDGYSPQVLRYQFNATTTAAVDGFSRLGYFALNHVNPAQADRFQISNYDLLIHNDAPYINWWGTGTSDIKGTLFIGRTSDNDAVIYNIEERTSTTGMAEFAVDYVSGTFSPALAGDDMLHIAFVPKGDKGATGPAGSPGTGGTRSSDIRGYATLAARNADTTVTDYTIAIVADTGSGDPGHFYRVNGEWNTGAGGARGMQGASVSVPYILDGNQSVPATGDIRGRFYINAERTTIDLALLDNDGQNRATYFQQKAGNGPIKMFIEVENINPNTGAPLGTFSMAVSAITVGARTIRLTKHGDTANATSGTGLGGSGSTLALFTTPKGDTGAPGLAGTNATPGRGSGFRYRRTTSTTAGSEQGNGGNFHMTPVPSIPGTFALTINRDDRNGQIVQGAMERFMGGTLSIYDSVADRYYIFAISNNGGRPLSGLGMTGAGFARLDAVSGITNPAALPATTSDCYLQFYGPNDPPDLSVYLLTASFTTTLAGALASFLGPIQTTGDHNDISTAGAGADIFTTAANVGAGRAANAEPSASQGNVTAAGFFQFGGFTTAQRNRQASGTLISGRAWYNSETNTFEGRAGNAVIPFGGGLQLPVPIQNNRRLGTDATGSLAYFPVQPDTGYTSARVVLAGAAGSGGITVGTDEADARRLVVTFTPPSIPDTTDHRAINVDTYTGRDNVVREVGNRLQLAALLAGGTHRQVIQRGNEPDLLEWGTVPRAPVTVTLIAEKVPARARHARGITITLPRVNNVQTTLGEYDRITFDVSAVLNLGNTDDLTDLLRFSETLDVPHQVASSSSRTAKPISKAQGSGGAALSIIPSQMQANTTSFNVFFKNFNNALPGDDLPFDIVFATGQHR